MNPGVILLIVLTVILLLGVIISTTWAIVEYQRSIDSGTGTTGPNIAPPCSQTVNIGELVQIPDIPSNCTQRGQPTSLYYIGEISGGKYDFVVAPWGTQPVDVCVGFCCSLSNGVCTGPNYNGLSAQTNFDRCMSQLAGTGCSPPVPIAAKGPIVYYAFSPTCNICDVCQGSSGPICNRSVR